jgi:thiol-disulfide isomerase/thioredoxin
MKRIVLLLAAILLLAAGCAGKTAPGPSQDVVPASMDTPAPMPTSAQEPVSETAAAAEAEGLGGLFADAVLQDLEGNEVSLGELISGNKLTLLNIWGTFCGPCISEMPGLGDLARTYAGQGFGIVGLTCDILDARGNIQPEIVEDARDILDTTGVDYPILALSGELAEATELQYVPTTYLVDAAGHILRGPIVSAMPASEWETLILECLAEAG